MDEYTFSLPRLWIGAIVICVLDIMQALSMLGHYMPHFALIGRLSPAVARFLFLYGHLVLIAAWLAVFILALKFHGLKGLSILSAMVVIIPASVIWWLTWICATRGACL
jgi:hypothetical protein